MLENFDINTNDENNYQKINKVMSDAINETKHYKTRNTDDIKDAVIKYKVPRTTKMIGQKIKLNF